MHDVGIYGTEVPLRVVVLVGGVRPQLLHVGQHVIEPLIVEGRVVRVAVGHAETPDGAVRLPPLDDVAGDVLYVRAAEDVPQKHDPHALVVAGEEEAQVGVLVPVGILISLGAARIMYKKGWLA